MIRAEAMSGAAHCVPSAPTPFLARLGTIEENVAGDITSVIGYSRPAFAESAKLLSFRMSGVSLPWIRDCTTSVNPVHGAICSLTLTPG